MSGGYQFIRELSAEKDDFTIKARVIRMWDATNLKTKLIMNKNLIMLDEEDNHIHVIIPVNQFDKFSNKLHVGNTYLISNIKIVPAPEMYRPLPGDKALNFYWKTIVKKVDGDSCISAYKFHFVRFDQAKIKVGDVVDLMDVVGRLTTFTEPQTTSNGSEKIDILIENQRGEKIKITLWEDKERAFLQENTIRNSNTRQVLLSSTSSTHSYFNIEHPAIHGLRTNEVTKPGKPKIVQSIHKDGQEPPKSINMTILELFNAKMEPDIKEIICNTEATITGIIPNFSWYYLACSSCFKRINGVGGNNQCHNCPNKDATPKYKYRVILKVKDATADTTFVMFDKQIMTLIGVPVQHILDTEHDATPYKIPAILNNMVGKTCLFNLTLTSDDIHRQQEEYTVTKVAHLRNEDMHIQEDGPGNSQNVQQSLTTNNLSQGTKKWSAEPDDDHSNRNSDNKEQQKTKQRKPNDEEDSPSKEKVTED
ncbi:hypothetical protein POM88_025597 [Heracleum sosnowskyi]|uniref:Replication factor A C-terminal domain-containing protein n=1 Tax=Heracleum sosnowskyi TaxID=360622 RepID=A0AAD8I6M8_9APIA|nr:hypothetical protein POM88_025597 [Heracleum sosnowskyi]